MGVVGGGRVGGGGHHDVTYVVRFTHQNELCRLRSPVLPVRLLQDLGPRSFAETRRRLAWPEPSAAAALTSATPRLSCCECCSCCYDRLLKSESKCFAGMG